MSLQKSLVAPKSFCHVTSYLGPVESLGSLGSCCRHPPILEKRGDPGRGLASFILPHSQSPHWLLFIQKQYSHLIISKNADCPSSMTEGDLLSRQFHSDSRGPQAHWVDVCIIIPILQMRPWRPGEAKSHFKAQTALGRQDFSAL